ncbi:hypothetical protein SAY86_023820 [Trapa natans]|uniref:C2 domain-containing protein n=1 Tax=Trapa natans TaxID=22666 RepID=A0AAN7R9N9_TRANT|nr:hypothetical protein SAY86_023820 [Trapa natans]
MSSIILNPFQLLELNIISAQDLAPVTRSMRTYAVAWVHPDRKLSTRVDSEGRDSPTWNDKFVFRVDDEFLTSDTSGVMIEIYATSHWFKDKLVGMVRILVGNLVPSPPARPFRSQQHYKGMRFAALQVRRPSGRPQGILNIGLGVLDSSMRSMPLYRQLSTSAVGYLNLMGEQNPYYHDHSHHHHQPNEILPKAAAKPELRRTKSDASSMQAAAVRMLKRRVSFREQPNSVINASTVLSYSVLGKGRNKKGTSTMPGSMVNVPSAFAFAGPKDKGSSEVASVSLMAADNNAGNGNGNALVNLALQGFEAAAVSKPPQPGKAYITESELGPSPSEVAAAVAAKLKQHRMQRDSSAVAAWSLNERDEGLQSKLERWRKELPPMFDRGYSTLPSSRGNREDSASKMNSSIVGGGKGSWRSPKRTEGGGLFSCVSNICGCECSIVCGQGSGSSSAAFET